MTFIVSFLSPLSDERQSLWIGVLRGLSRKPQWQSFMVDSHSSFPSILTLMSPSSLSSSYTWQDRLIVFSRWIPNTALPTVEVGGVRLATDSAIQYCSIQTLYRGTFCFSSSSRCEPSFLVRAVSTGLLVSCVAGAIYWYPKNQLPRTSSTMSIPLTGRVWGDDGWVRLVSLAPIITCQGLLPFLAKTYGRSSDSGRAKFCCCF
jgi:hypothetical protein